MDIHECFEYKIEKFNELVKKINEKPKEDTDFSTPFISQWEYFESFLSDLLSDNNSIFRNAILKLFFNEEKKELHEKIKELFNLLAEYNDKTLISMVYDSNYDRVEVKFNKSEDMMNENELMGP